MVNKRDTMDRLAKESAKLRERLEKRHNDVKKLSKENADLVSVLHTAYTLICKHHHAGYKIEWGQFCPVCVAEDGEMAEFNSISDVLFGSTDGAQVLPRVVSDKQPSSTEPAR